MTHSKEDELIETFKTYLDYKEIIERIMKAINDLLEENKPDKKKIIEYHEKLERINNEILKLLR